VRYREDFTPSLYKNTSPAVAKKTAKWVMSRMLMKIV